MKTENVKKLTKILLIVLVVIVASLKFIAEPLIEKKIRSWEPKKKNFYYDIHIGDVNAKILRGGIDITGLTLKINKDEVSKLDSADIPHLFEVETDIGIHLFNGFRLLFEDEIKINEVDLENTNITWYPNFKKQKKDSLSGQSSGKVKIDAVQLGELLIDQAHIIVMDKYGSDAKEILNLDSLIVEIHQLNVPIGESNEEVLPEFKEIIIHSGKFEFDYDSVNYKYDHLIVNTSHEKSADNFFLDIEMVNLTSKIDNNEVNINRIHVKDINFESFYLDNKIEIDSIVIADAEIKWFKSAPKEQTADTTKKKSKLKQISINHFGFTDESFLYVLDNDKNLAIDTLTFYLDSLEIDPLDIKKVFYSDLYLEMNKTAFDMGSDYRIETGKIKLNRKAKTVSLNGFALIPKHTPEEYSKMIDYEKDLFSVNLDSVVIQYILRNRLSSEEIRIPEIDVYNLNLEVYRDKYVEDAPKIDKPFPATMINNIEFPFDIEKINIHNSTVAYTQLGDIVETDVPGRLEMNNTNIVIQNITNIPGLQAKDKVMTVDATTELMGAGKVTTGFEFDLTDETKFFKAHGKMDQLPMVRLNPFLSGLLRVEVPQGEVKDLEFSMEANHDYIKGTLDMEYQDLNVDVLKNNNPEKHHAFLNLIANAAIKTDNIKGEKNYKQGTIFADVRPYKFVFHNFWQGIKSGLMDVMVKPVNKEKSLKKFEKKEEDIIQ